MGLLIIFLVAALLIVLFALQAKGEKSAMNGNVPLSEATRRMAVSIARFETGYWLTHPQGGFALNASLWQGRAKPNKNPGNLRFINQPEAIGKDAGNYAIFPSETSGWNALLFDVRSKLLGRTRTQLGPESTIEQFITTWAPPEDNNPTARYIEFVSKEVGIAKDVPFVAWVDYSGSF